MDELSKVIYFAFKLNALFLKAADLRICYDVKDMQMHHGNEIWLWPWEWRLNLISLYSWSQTLYSKASKGKSIWSRIRSSRVVTHEAEFILLNHMKDMLLFNINALFSLRSDERQILQTLRTNCELNFWSIHKFIITQCGSRRFFYGWIQANTYIINMDGT